MLFRSIRRNVKRTQRAQELLDSGEIVPGSPAPSEASLRTIPAEDAVASMMAPDKFRIYDWELPWPTDFTDLPEGRRNWKVEVDMLEKETDVDDGSDGMYALNLEFGFVRSRRRCH